MRIGAIILDYDTGSGGHCCFGKMGAVRDGDDSWAVMKEGWSAITGLYHHSSGRRFYALANLMYYALVIMRRQKAIFTVYLAAAAAGSGIIRPSGIKI